MSPYCIKYGEWLRQQPNESLLIRRKDAVWNMKNSQNLLLALDAEIARRLADVSASVPAAARHDDTDQGGRP